MSIADYWSLPELKRDKYEENKSSPPRMEETKEELIARIKVLSKRCEELEKLLGL